MVLHIFLNPSELILQHLGESFQSNAPFHDEILETNGVSIFLFTNFDRPNNHQSDKTHLFILSQLLCLHFQGIVLMQHLPMIANDELSMSVNVIASDTS